MVAPRDLRLYGQEDNGAVWAICRMNLLLHGIPDADIRNGDTLLDPKHIEDGRLMRFDRVIANPPFSQNYTKRGIQFGDRFRFGWCPTTGKKADLMFAQHMLASLKQTGKMAVGHAAWRAVPRRRREEDPDRAARRRTASRPSSACRRTSSTARASRPASS